MHYVAQKYDQFESLVLEFFVSGQNDFEFGGLNESETTFMTELTDRYDGEVETTDQLDSLQEWVRWHRIELHDFSDERIREFIQTF